MLFRCGKGLILDGGITVSILIIGSLAKPDSG